MGATGEDTALGHGLPDRNPSLSLLALLLAASEQALEPQRSLLCKELPEKATSNLWPMHGRVPHRDSSPQEHTSSQSDSQHAEKQLPSGTYICQGSPSICCTPEPFHAVLERTLRTLPLLTAPSIHLSPLSKETEAGKGNRAPILEKNREPTNEQVEIAKTIVRMEQ